jgi:uncharacterized membrane protein YfcA
VYAWSANGVIFAGKHEAMKRRRDWPLIIGIVAGAFVGAVAIAYFATNQFYLYRFQTSYTTQIQDPTTFHRSERTTTGLYHPTALPERLKGAIVGVVYDWPSIWLWASVGLVVGAFLGAVAVSLLRAVNRHQPVTK